MLTLCPASIFAQSSAVKKAANAVVSITTFDADGKILATTNGVFISADGTIAAPWSPFASADHAVAIDAKGVKHDIDGQATRYTISRLYALQASHQHSSPCPHLRQLLLRYG